MDFGIYLWFLFMHEVFVMYMNINVLWPVGLRAFWRVCFDFCKTDSSIWSFFGIIFLY